MSLKSRKEPILAMNSKMRRHGSDAAATILNAYVTTGKVRSNYVTNDVAAKDVLNNQLHSATTPPPRLSYYFNFGQHDALDTHPVLAASVSAPPAAAVSAPSPAAASASTVPVAEEAEPATSEDNHADSLQVVDKSESEYMEMDAHDNGSRVPFSIKPDVVYGQDPARQNERSRLTIQSAAGRARLPPPKQQTEMGNSSSSSSAQADHLPPPCPPRSEVSLLDTACLVTLSAASLEHFASSSDERVPLPRFEKLSLALRRGKAFLQPRRQNVIMVVCFSVILILVSATIVVIMKNTNSRHGRDDEELEDLGLKTSITSTTTSASSKSTEFSSLITSSQAFTKRATTATPDVCTIS